MYVGGLGNSGKVGLTLRVGKADTEE